MSAALWIYGLPACVGVALALLLGLPARDTRTKLQPLAFLGWSWCLGVFATGVATFGWLGWIGQRVGAPDPTDQAGPAQVVPTAGGEGLGTPWAVRAVLLVVLLAASWAVRARSRTLQLDDASTAPRREGSGLEGLAFALCTTFAFVTAVLRLLHGTLRPIVEDDEANFWALKAQMLFVKGGFSEAFGALAQEPRLYNADYPLFNPLLQVWSFANAGELTHVANRVPIQLFGLALLGVLTPALFRVARPGLAGLLLVVCASLAEVSSQLQRGHGDLMVALGALVACDAWLRWHASRERVWLRLAGFGLAFLVWSKNEGLLVLVALVGAALLVSLLRRLAALLSERTAERGGDLARGPSGTGLASAWPWALFPGAVVLLSRTVNAHFGWKSGFLQNDLREGTILDLLRSQFAERIGPVLSYYWHELALAPAFSGGLLLLLAGLWLCAPRRLAASPLAVVSLTAGIVYVGHMLVFIGAPHDLTWHLTTAAQRIGFQPLPAVTLIVAAAFPVAFPALGPAHSRE